MKSELYEQDFVLWTQQTAADLRAGRFDQIDIENTAEEIESLGRSDKRTVRNRLAILIMHLLKWEMQPERRSGSWSATIVEQRFRLKMILKDSPSLRICVESFVAEAYPHAVDKAVRQMRLLKNPFPVECPYNVKNILDTDFWPGC
jgi:hypothetical protein